MKMNKYIFGTLLISSFLIGCDQDNITRIYESDTYNYISFQNDVLNKEVEKTENTLEISIYRESTQGNASVTAELFFQQDGNGGEQPGREFISLDNNIITFAEGNNEAKIKLNIDLVKLDYLTKAKTQIRLTPKENCSVSPFGKSAITVSISRKPTWDQMEEKGIYTSQFLGTEKEVTVMKAEEAPFYIVKDCYVENGDIRIDLDQNGNATIEQQKAFIYPEYGVVYVAGTGQLNKISNTIITQMNFLVEQDGKWGILSGVAFEETLKLPNK